jgi:trehalose 6-phosphate phosphatase
MGKSIPDDLPTLDLARSALFLDYDGTLVGIAPTPAEARADDALLELLARLQERLGGALAIVSGRGVDDLDRMLAPLRLTVAGLHGLEVRPRDAGPPAEMAGDAMLTPARAALAGFAARFPGTLVEDKRLSLALHYRLAPEAAHAAELLAERLAAESAGALRLQRGKMVVELLPAGRDKGRAIGDLLLLADFSGRLPVFVGDDVTDEAGFRLVNDLGGVTVRVGTAEAATNARHRLADIAALRRWLRAALARDAG